MNKEFRTIAILGRHEDPHVAEPMATLASYLTKADIEVIALESATTNLTVRFVEEEEIADLADLIVAVGGDGTMLYAADLAREHNVPRHGIHRGRLGYLAHVPTEQKLQSSSIGDGFFLHIRAILAFW